MMLSIRKLSCAFALTLLPATSGNGVSIQPALPTELGIGAKIGGTTFVKQNSCSNASTAAFCGEQILKGQETVYTFPQKGVSSKTQILPN